MKKKIFGGICAVVATLALVFGVFWGYSKGQQELEDISYHADFYEYSYEELKEDSHVIALIEVMDELTEKNSEAIMSQGNMVGNIGRRQVKVLQYFKDERNYGDTLTILEPASVIKNQYLHPEDYDRLEKGNTYLVFLSDETATKELSIMSAYNGTFDMDNLNDINNYYDLAIKSIVEYMTDLPDEQKEEIINAEKIEKVNNLENADIEAEVMGARDELELDFAINANGEVEVQIIE